MSGKQVDIITAFEICMSFIACNSHNIVEQIKENLEF